MRIGFLVILAGLSPLSLSAQAVITGTVRENSSGRPLGLVEVTVEGSKRQATTDATGRYLLESPSGNQVILFRLIGYGPQRIRVIAAKRDTVLLDAVLVKQSAQELPEVEVKERPAPVRGSVMAGFEERRRQGFGKFIDSSAMRKLEGRRVMEILRGLGLRFIGYQPNRGLQEWRAVSSNTGTLDHGEPCWVSVFLDGVPIYKAGIQSMQPPDFSKEFIVMNLMAAEYYRSAASVPSEFGVGRDTDCGVLVLWTRRGS